MKDHITDIVVRSIKTFAAAFVATLTASGVNVAHLTISKQLAVAALAAGATAVLNTGLKVHAAVTAPLTPSVSLTGAFTTPVIPEDPTVPA